MTNAVETLDLTRLDQTVLRVYVRQLLIFPFPDPAFRKDASAILAAALLATFKQFPFLVGTVEQTDPATGAMTVRYPKTVDSELVSRLLTTNTLDREEMDYQSLCEAGIPPFRLPANDLCPFAMRSHPGIDDTYAEVLTTFSKKLPIPVFAAQINFIPGGLVLSAYTHHCVVDGTGIATIYEVWSGNTRSYDRGMTSTRQANVHELSAARHALDTLIADAKPMNLSVFRFPGDPMPPPLRDTPFNVSAKLLVFSAPTVSKLAASLSSITGQRISNFTALASFIWCQATNARRAAIMAKGIEKTTLGIATDHRKRVGSLLPKDYLGNVANGMIVSVPLSSIPNSGSMNAEGIAVVALALSNALAGVDLDWFRAILLEMAKQKNSSKLMLNCNTMNGPDIFITSWQHIGADTVWAIPGTAKEQNGEGWASKPTAIRKPHNLWEGGMQILPRRKGDDAPYEIPLCLEEGDMERVLHSLQEGNWVERVIEA
ncbi:uncharacterized protein M421DRAFT_424188 [Didymella exigua CBS 183.55]|uniref:Trichothecene 3-O-acetyltransferase n=1 Tax=Didymella exigua CBS 183.55 TaxID=1150837 RepID=A0A6A5RHT9_9PLEO|nr:uncharacterized protein M421DRAFT_424188 [Didymella exigua CBS 183.55]KAF1925167.1 hypothetical protein M421DRAFT_424188 [Didymella exigua CBS 183.55]